MLRTRYLLVALFLGCVLIISFSYGAVPTTPPAVANYITQTLACAFSYIMRIVLLFVPVVLLLGVYGKFIFFSRRREEGHISLVEDLIIATVLVVLLALVIRLVYGTMEFFGVPVSKMIKDLYTNTEMFPKFKFEVCPEDNPMGRGLSFLLTFSAFFLKLALYAIMVLAVFLPVERRIALGIEQVRRGEVSKEYVFLVVVGYIFATSAFSLLIASATLGILYIDINSIINWGSNALRRAFVGLAGGSP